MIPIRALADQLAELLATNTTALANASAVKVGLIVAPFTAAHERVMADLSISAATGLVPIAGTAGAQNASVDPVTGDKLVEIKVPAGGFRWETPGGFTGPVTVYGFALGNNAMTTLWGMHVLTTPQTLDGEGQSITAPTLLFRIDSSKVH